MWTFEFLEPVFKKVSSAGLELARVPRVPGTRGIFGQYCLAPADFGNFTTQRYVLHLKFEDLLLIGTPCFKFPTQALLNILSSQILYRFLFNLYPFFVEMN